MGAPGHVPPRPRTLLTTCPALVARRGTRQAWSTILLKLSALWSQGVHLGL